MKHTLSFLVLSRRWVGWRNLRIWLFFGRLAKELVHYNAFYFFHFKGYFFIEGHILPSFEKIVCIIKSHLWIWCWIILSTMFLLLTFQVVSSYDMTIYSCFDLNSEPLNSEVPKWIIVSGLAGLRVGYGAFPLSIIEYLWRAKQPYNVSVAAEISACAALQNPIYLEVNSWWFWEQNLFICCLCTKLSNQSTVTSRMLKMLWSKKERGFMTFWREFHSSDHFQAILTSFFVRLLLEWTPRSWRYLPIFWSFFSLFADHICIWSLNYAILEFIGDLD